MRLLLGIIFCSIDYFVFGLLSQKHTKFIIFEVLFLAEKKGSKIITRRNKVDLIFGFDLVFDLK